MMKIALSKPIREEKGQALILVMILLLVGSIIIAPLLGFMSTGLLAGQVFEKKMHGLYAADAGIEDALWKIKNDQVPPDPYQLTDVNGMVVDIVIEEGTIIFGEEVGDWGPNYWALSLESEFLYYDGDENWGIYNYRLILTNKHKKNITIEEVIIGYSAALSYLSGLVDGNVDGLKDGNDSFEVFDPNPPVETVVGNSKILTWEFPSQPTRPVINGNPGADRYDPDTWVTVTTTFQLEGPPDNEGIAAYLVASSDDIGTVWEFKPWWIIATADDGSTVVTTVTARALVTSTVTLISSWEIE